MEKQLPGRVLEALYNLGLADPEIPVVATPLIGGVASDIWRVSQGNCIYCVKQALSRLKVAQSWEVPVERNAYEVAWFREVARLCPDAVPRVLGHDIDAGVFVMDYLEPELFPNWKQQLMSGRVNSDTAMRVADTLVHIHAGTAGDRDIANRFPEDDLFHAIRLEPYFLATAKAQPALLPVLTRLVDSVLDNKKALIHGDVSPKNILVGSRGPVILDAECAWYGDPAFDIAFLLNHLLLKSIYNPAFADLYRQCFDVMTLQYLSGVDWESVSDLQARVAAMLPALFLARVDGKSPVEYLPGDQQQALVRTIALPLIIEPLKTIEAVGDYCFSAQAKRNV